jgi:hypothetical protein
VAGAGAVGAALVVLVDLGASEVARDFLVTAMGVFLTFQDLDLNIRPTPLPIASGVPKLIAVEKEQSMHENEDFRDRGKVGHQCESEYGLKINHAWVN